MRKNYLKVVRKASDKKTKRFTSDIFINVECTSTRYIVHVSRTWGKISLRSSGFGLSVCIFGWSHAFMTFFRAVSLFVIVNYIYTIYTNRKLFQDYFKCTSKFVIKQSNFNLFIATE